MTRAVEIASGWWLAGANLLVALFVGLPFAAPVLMAYGFDGLANEIYAAYKLVCHQWAFRSYFLFGAQAAYSLDVLAQVVGHDHAYGFLGSPELGYKVAFCERDVAIYAAVLVAGLAYAVARERVRPLELATYGLLILPMALDGFSQLFGWRESTVELRTLTGALFGLASVWLVYPRIDAALGTALADRPMRVADAAT